jgi:hypothetical protein
MMDYACPIWRSAARSHVQKLQVLQAKCIRFATNAHWYVGNRKIHDKMQTPFLTEHIRALTGSFESKLADAENPLFRQLGRHLRRPRVDWSPPGNSGELTFSRPTEAVPQKTAKSAQWVVLWLLGYADWGFPFFSSVVRQMPGYNSEGARPASPITEAFRRTHSPRQIGEAFSQSDTNISGFNSQESHPTKIRLVKNKLSDWVIPH